MTARVGAVRILVALDITEEQSRDLPDLIASIDARVRDEAGYLDPDGDPIVPVSVVVALVEDAYDDPTEDQLTEINPETLRGIYEVGVEGLQ